MPFLSGNYINGPEGLRKLSDGDVRFSTNSNTNYFYIMKKFHDRFSLSYITANDNLANALRNLLVFSDFPEERKRSILKATEFDIIDNKAALLSMPMFKINPAGVVPCYGVMVKNEEGSLLHLPAFGLF